jgi:hypothetical protein
MTNDGVVHEVTEHSKTDLTSAWALIFIVGILGGQAEAPAVNLYAEGL